MSGVERFLSKEISLKSDDSLEPEQYEVVLL
jgi:hypothetical protein